MEKSSITFKEKIFLNEIKKQCDYALIAYNSMNDSLLNKSTKMFWYSLQNFLISTANISKILWPPNKKYQKRGQSLKKKLKIDEKSPLKNREFRNHFEHYDERLEKWANSKHNNFYIDSNIGPLNSIKISNIKNVSTISQRHFDPTTFTLIFQGKELEILPIVNEIKRISNQIDNILNNSYIQKP